MVLVFKNNSKGLKNWKCQIVVEKRIYIRGSWLRVKLLQRKDFIISFPVLSTPCCLFNFDDFSWNGYYGAVFAWDFPLICGNTVTDISCEFRYTDKNFNTGHTWYTTVLEKSLFRINFIDAMCGLYLFIHFRYYFNSFFQFLD